MCEMEIIKEKARRVSGFTMAEMLIVVAIIAILSAVAAAFFNPDDISYVEYNRSAEAIAVAAQNSMTSHRTSGDAAALRLLRTVGQSASVDPGAEGGYRYIFSHVKNEDGGYETNPDMKYILPAGAVDYDLADKYFAIGFQSVTCTVGEVFYSEKPFGEGDLGYLKSTDEAGRKAARIGYYEGETDDAEVAFANLPTPQVTVSNYENLTLSVYLPEVKQLEDLGKSLAFRVSLADENGEAYKNGITLDDAAIYRTYGEPETGEINRNVPQKIDTGVTYTFILDTPQPCTGSEMRESLTGLTPPTGKFEEWAKRSAAFSGGKRYFKLGDNVRVTVTVFCLDDVEGEYTVDPTFMPRSASVTFNGWFNTYDGSHTVTIACGRHLQNLGNLSESDKNIAKYLPTVEKTGDGYTYSNFDRGMAANYTDAMKDSSVNANKKYVYRDGVEDQIYQAEQVKTIDFDCAEWRCDGKQIPFKPINLPYVDIDGKDSFRYYGNYMTINHLYVDAPFYAGLFGFAYHHRLYDILLVDPYVTSHVPADVAEMYEIGAGALIGTSRNSDYIYNCQVYMTEDKEDYRVSGAYYVGGLIGFCEDEDIKSCSASVNTGKVDPDHPTQYVGGLIGCITGDSSLENCYAAGNLRGGCVGGLVGLILSDSYHADNDYRVGACYTAGHIEYAQISAAGLFGRIDEKSGYARTAVNARGNYCVVVYGEKDGDSYNWDSTAPIYGTFKGDGFEWISTTEKGNQLTGRYSGAELTFGAVFEDDDLNYFIPQKGIEYSDSEYYTNASKLLNEFIGEAGGITDASELKALAAEYKEKLGWIRKLQILDEMDELLREMTEDFDNEKGTGIDGRPYNWGGYRSSDSTRVSGDLYLELKRAIVEDAEDKGHDPIKLTAQEILHAIYDGTGIGSKGIEYKGGDDNFKGAKEYNFIFTELKAKITGCINDLIDKNEGNDENAVKTLRELLGDDSGDKAYQNGFLYKIYYQRLLYRLFDKSKDYYDESGINDKTGEMIYRYYRGQAERWDDLLIDLSMTSETREELLLAAAVAELKDNKTSLPDDAAALEKLANAAERWTNGMKEYSAECSQKLSFAAEKINAMITAKDNNNAAAFSLSASEAYELLSELYEFFDNHKNEKDFVNESGEKKDDMRNFRDPVETIMEHISFCPAAVNSGAEGAIDELIYRLGEGSADCAAPRDACIKKLNIYLGKNWEDHDSGHRIYSAKELRNLSRGFPKGTDTGDENNRDSSIKLGLMYDYKNDYYGYNNPYKKTVGGSGRNAYVNEDNGIYNNVFPYTESAYSRYYPFPFVFGREIKDIEDDKKNYQATFILFHYGDWLTDDLWAVDETSGGAG